MTVEILAPIAIFLWLGLSALFVSFLSWGLGLSPYAQCIIYACVAPAITWFGRYFFPSGRPEEGHNENINSKMHQMIGRVFTLSVPITGEAAQMPVDNSVWLVKGSHLSAGTVVKIVKVDGVTLYVEPTEK